jgi:hypothetical protein
MTHKASGRFKGGKRLRDPETAEEEEEVEPHKKVNRDKKQKFRKKKWNRKERLQMVVKKCRAVLGNLGVNGGGWIVMRTFRRFEG